MKSNIRLPFYTQEQPRELIKAAQNQPKQLSKFDARPTVQNIVTTAKLSVKDIDLVELALNCANVDYRPRRFSAATIRIREPKTTALVFSSGKVICVGAKTKEISQKAIK